MRLKTMKTRWFILLLSGVLACPGFAKAQHTERGAAIGGIGGALAGAAIGKNNGDTAAGALIGGALGLFTGAAIGGSADARERQAAVANQQAYMYSRAVSSVDVITMSQNQVGEEVIINHIRENGVQRRPDVSEVISLHRQGVSERVIATMQNAPEGGPAVRAVAPSRTVIYSAPRPPIVEYHYVPEPWCPPPHYHYYHHHHHRPHSHVHWGFSFH